MSAAAAAPAPGQGERVALPQMPTRLGERLPDGRICVPYKGRIYYLHPREAETLMTELRRLLTTEKINPSEPQRIHTHQFEGNVYNVNDALLTKIDAIYQRSLAQRRDPKEQAAEIYLAEAQRALTAFPELRIQTALQGPKLYSSRWEHWCAVEELLRTVWQRPSPFDRLTLALAKTPLLYGLKEAGNKRFGIFQNHATWDDVFKTLATARTDAEVPPSHRLLQLAAAAERVLHPPPSVPNYWLVAEEEWGERKIQILHYPDPTPRRPLVAEALECVAARLGAAGQAVFAAAQSALDPQLSQQRCPEFEALVRAIDSEQGETPLALHVTSDDAALPFLEQLKKRHPRWQYLYTPLSLPSQLYTCRGGLRALQEALPKIIKMPSAIQKDQQEAMYAASWNRTVHALSTVPGFFCNLVDSPQFLDGKPFSKNHHLGVFLLFFYAELKDQLKERMPSLRYLNAGPDLSSALFERIRAVSLSGKRDPDFSAALATTLAPWAFSEQPVPKDSVNRLTEALLILKQTQLPRPPAEWRHTFPVDRPQ